MYTKPPPLTKHVEQFLAYLHWRYCSALKVKPSLIQEWQRARRTVTWQNNIFFGSFH